MQGLEVTSPAPTMLTLTWDPPRQSNGLITQYIVRYKELRTSDCVVEHSTWSEKHIVRGTEQRYPLVDLRAYTRYQIRIWPETEAGKGIMETKAAVTQAISKSWMDCGKF